MNKLELKYLDEWQKYYYQFFKENSDSIDWKKFVHFDSFNFSLIDIVPTNNNEYNIWVSLSSRNDLTLEVLEKYIHKPWVWQTISSKEILTIDFIQRYPNDDYYYFALTENKNITFDFIIENYEKHWNWFYIRKRFVLSEKEILSEIDKPWVINYINAGGCASEAVIKKICENPDNIDKIHWFYVSQSINIDIIKQLPELPLFGCYSWEVSCTILTRREMKLAWEKSGCEKKINDDMINIFLGQLRRYPKVKWDWFSVSLGLPLNNMDFLTSSDIYSGWSIISMIRNEIISLEYIRARFPDEFKFLCDTDDRIRELYDDITISEKAMIIPTEPQECSVIRNYKSSFVKRNFILGLLIRDGLIEFNESVYSSVDSIKQFEAKISELESKYVNQWYAYYNPIMRKIKDKIIWTEFILSKNFNYELIDIVPADVSLWLELSERNDLTIDIIEKHIDKPWCFNRIFSNGKISTEFIRKHSNILIHGEYFFLSNDNKIPLQFIIENYEKQWNWEKIRERFYLTDEEIIARLNEPWIIKYITQGGNISETVFRKAYVHYQSLGINFDFYEISKELNVDLITKTTDLPWDFNFAVGFGSYDLKTKQLNVLGKFLTAWIRNRYNKQITKKVITAIMKKTELNKDMEIPNLLKKMRKYPMVGWKWNKLGKNFQLKENNFLLPSDINSGWKISSMIKHGITTLDYIKTAFPDEFKILCQNNDKINTLHDISMSQCNKLTNQNVMIDSKLLCNAKINSIKKNFIRELILRDGLIEFKEKIKKVNDEFNEVVCNPDNIEKLKELQCINGF